MPVEGIRIRNYRALHEITMGRIDDGDAEPLTDLVAVIGKNGVGKNSLFDAFSFLSDCLRSGAEEACESQLRGGFSRIVSGGARAPVEFDLRCKLDETDTVAYSLAVASDGDGRPYVLRETLRGDDVLLLDLENGQGVVRTESGENKVELSDPRRTGVSVLGSLGGHERISKFKKFMSLWHFSYFTPEAARTLPVSGPQRRLAPGGGNLSNVVEYMERNHPDRFERILERIASGIPGIRRIRTERSADGRLLLSFDERGFVDPFYASQMSDGTLRLFAYLLLLEDPDPPTFLAIRTPENGLYHKLLEALAREFRNHASERKTQIFVTTHQPYFVDELDPDETWILEKESDGFSRIRRATEHPHVRSLVEEGLTLGSLWFGDHFDGRDDAL